MKTALITGITGQTGSYLAELLLSKGYSVHGIIRRSSSFTTGRIDHIFDRIKFHFGDLSDASGLSRIVSEVKPDEVYNLGAQSHVRVSFDAPEYTTDIDATGTVRLLEAIKSHAPEARFYQASSSEMFGLVQEVPQVESTPFYPRSPYGCAKVFSYWLTVNYRESGMHASNGILFNHESPRRGETFVTRKITKAIANIVAGKQKTLSLGNINSCRDWGFAGDYAEAIFLMLQQERPDDYVIATGETHSVKAFLEIAFCRVGLKWEDYVVIDPKYFRPTEVDLLLGDATKAKQKLGWEPKIKFKGLVEMMVDAELVWDNK